MYFFRETQLKKLTNLRQALIYVKGINYSKSDYVFSLLGFAKSSRVYHMNKYYYGLMTFLVKNTYLTGATLTRMRQNNLRVLEELKTVRSVMHGLGLPAHGQRTRDNRETKRRLRNKV